MKNPILSIEKNDRVLDDRLRDHLGAAAFDSLSDDDRNGLKQHFKLLILYPGEFVAFRDHWVGEGDSLRLRDREVLCHSRRQRVIQEFLVNLPHDGTQGIQMEFVEQPGKRITIG